MTVHKRWNYSKKKRGSSYFEEDDNLSEFKLVFKVANVKIESKIKKWIISLKSLSASECESFCWGIRELCPYGFTGDIENICDHIRSLIDYDIREGTRDKPGGLYTIQNELFFGIRREFDLIQIQSYIQYPHTARIIFRDQFILKCEKDLYYWCGRGKKAILGTQK